MVDRECDDDYEGQNETQNEGEGFLQALPLVSDALVGCRKGNNEHSEHAEVTEFMCIVYSAWVMIQYSFLMP